MKLKIFAALVAIMFMFGAVAQAQTKTVTLRITEINPERGWVNQHFTVGNAAPIPERDRPVKDCAHDWRPSSGGECTDGVVLRGENSPVNLELNCEPHWSF